MTRRIVFLDIDGVLNRTGFAPTSAFELRDWIEPELAERCARLLRETGAAIVLSSDWRLETTVDELRQQLAAAGLDAPLAGVTPELHGTSRWREIEAWMVEHAIARETVAIVDDFHDMGPLGDRFVRTDPAQGLDDANVAAIVALLGS